MTILPTSHDPQPGTPEPWSSAFHTLFQETLNVLEGEHIPAGMPRQAAADAMPSPYPTLIYEDGPRLEAQFTPSIEAHIVTHYPASESHGFVPTADAASDDGLTGIHDRVLPATESWLPSSELHVGGPFALPAPLIGDQGWNPMIKQQLDDCVIKSEQYIINEFTGQDVSESTLIHEAIQHGWFVPGQGTPLEDLGNLLELHGIAVNRYQHADIFHLTGELAQGHKVMIAVDSSELWARNPVLPGIAEAAGAQGANHVVLVSGIDTSDPANVQVIVGDPGTGEPAARYALTDFVMAWRTSDFTMVATREPVPNTHPAMVNFDYAIGHIATVGELPYDQFVALDNQAESLAQFFDFH